MRKDRDLEWLVSDSQGAFAMGTALGVRTRKYHGFYMGIPGRTQTAYLADLEFECNGISLWPHLYWGPQGMVQNPDGEALSLSGEFKNRARGPAWQWKLAQGQLTFRVEAARPAGITVSWDWASHGDEPALLKVRGFWAMRDLHALGGQEWAWKCLDFNSRLRSASGGQGTIVSQAGDRVAFCYFRGPWQWKDHPLWYERFYYPIEIERGYEGQEDLYSAGVFEVILHPGESCEWWNSVDPGVFELGTPSEHFLQSSYPSRVFDFKMTHPAGIVAGFPWFGEWGRDTFVSLPGLAAAWLDGEAPSGEFKGSVPWIRELLNRWGSWIHTKGSLPNVLEANGQLQWDSCDATLWWCHSLSGLWTYTLVFQEFYPTLKLEFMSLLEEAIEAIAGGRHRFLKMRSDGLLEVTEAYTSWMDARIGGQPVTPRLGALPEINALWFQAIALYQLWGGHIRWLKGAGGLAGLGLRVLECGEPTRPNVVFMHSIPLAPSFVLSALGLPVDGCVESDLMRLYEEFWTPVGLRTLSLHDPRYLPFYRGHPTERDASYHQGPVWAWLGGHFEVACDRLSWIRSAKLTDPSGWASALLGAKTLPPTFLNQMPILGHIAELFDGDSPFAARGAPAQAWSLACLEEASARRRWKLDQKITVILMQYNKQGSFV